MNAQVSEPVGVNSTVAGTAIAQRRRRLLAMGVAAAIAATLLVLHIRVQEGEVRGSIEVIAQLTTVKIIDTRWDAAIARARAGSGGPADAAVQESDLARIERALELAARHAHSNAQRTSAQELLKAYRTKAESVGRLVQSVADSRQALDAAMRADAAVTAQVRGAWHDFPQRERLVAAENVMARVLAEAQQYHYTPTPARRAALAAYTADLSRAQTLPRPIEAGLARLESDVHRLLLLKPLEQQLLERVVRLDTVTRLDELTAVLGRELDQARAGRDFYRLLLFVFSGVAFAFASYGVWLYAARMKALAARCARAEADLVQLQAREDARAQNDTGAAGTGMEPDNVRFIRRP